jgi:hypothetical protein
MSDVTRLLAQIDSGDPHAPDQLLPLVYAELRKLAAAKLALEKPGQTLQATALVHEAYLRLVASGGPGTAASAVVAPGDAATSNDAESAADSSLPPPPSFHSRGHFFAAAAEAMRRILVEAARRKKREKHGGQLKRMDLADVAIGVDLPPDQLLIIDESLEQLAAADPQAAQLVKLHCFAGLTIEQAAELLGIPARTAYRDWAYARGWLFRAMERDEQRPAG